jgi:hypothetical protein
VVPGTGPSIWRRGRHRFAICDDSSELDQAANQQFLHTVHSIRPAVFAAVSPGVRLDAISLVAAFDAEPAAALVQLGIQRFGDFDWSCLVHWQFSSSSEPTISLLIQVKDRPVGGLEHGRRGTVKVESSPGAKQQTPQASDLDAARRPVPVLPLDLGRQVVHGGGQHPDLLGQMLDRLLQGFQRLVAGSHQSDPFWWKIQEWA